MSFELLQETLIAAGIGEELLQVRSLEDLLAYLKSSDMPRIIFIEMTQLLVSTSYFYQKILSFRQSNIPLIACLVFSEDEIQVIDKLDLQIDHFLVMPETMELNPEFIKNIRTLADRSK